MNPAPGHPSRSLPGEGPRRRLGVLVTWLVLASMLTGCGLRLDSAPPPPDPPDATEVARQEAARAAEELGHAAAAAGTGAGEGVAAVLGAVGEASTAHADALGGVWQAWPDGVPEGTDHTPVPTPTAAEGATAQDVLDLLVQAAGSARQEALAVPDADLAALLTSVTVWRTFAALDLARAMGVEVEVPTGAPYPVGAVAESQVDSRTVGALDAGRYAYEVVAARTDGDRRDRAIGRAEHLAALTGAAATRTRSDPRRGAYPLAEDAAGTAVQAEERLLQQWVFRTSVAPRAQRRELLDAALHAAAELRAWGGTVAALPGIG